MTRSYCEKSGTCFLGGKDAVLISKATSGSNQ